MPFPTFKKEKQRKKETGKKKKKTEKLDIYQAGQNGMIPELTS